MRDLFGLLILLVAGVGAVLAYNGLLWTTGDTWYHACWQLEVGSKDFKTPVAPDPETEALWKTCEPIALRAFYASGMMFAGKPENNSDNNGFALQAACPSTWSDVPIGGFYILAINTLQENGGASLLDRFLPAEQSLARSYKKKWPTCELERIRQGYPDIAETKPGVFDWAQPCTICK